MSPEQAALFILWAIVIMPVFAVYWPAGILYFFFAQYVGFNGSYITPTAPVFLFVALIGRVLESNFKDGKD